MNTTLNSAHQQPQPQPFVMESPPQHFFDGFFATYSQLYRHAMESIPKVSWHLTHQGDDEADTTPAKKDVQDYLDSIGGFERIVSAKALFLCALSSHPASTFVIHYSVLQWIPMPGQSPDRGNTLCIFMLKEPNEVCCDNNSLLSVRTGLIYDLESFAEELITLAHKRGWQDRRSKHSQGVERTIKLTNGNMH